MEIALQAGMRHARQSEMARQGRGERLLLARPSGPWGEKQPPTPSACGFAASCPNVFERPLAEGTPIPARQMKPAKISGLLPRKRSRQMRTASAVVAEQA